MREGAIVSDFAPLSYRLRYVLVWDHGLSRAVLSAFARTLLDAYARSARQRGIRGGRTGTVTVLQRFGIGVNLTSTSIRWRWIAMALLAM